MLTRQASAFLLVLLLAVPCWADPAMVAIAVNGQSATLDGKRLEPGTALFSGETITIGPRGGSWIALVGGGHLYVGPSSQLRVSQAGRSIRFELLRGNAAFRFAEKPQGGRLADATFRSANGQPVVATVEVLNLASAILTAEQGTLLVSLAREPRSIALQPSEGLRMALAPPAKKDSGNGLTGPLITALIIGGAVTAIAAVLAHRENQHSAAENCSAVAVRCP